MNEKTLEYAREQLRKLRQPALMGRKHDETDIGKKMDGKRKEVGEMSGDLISRSALMQSLRNNVLVDVTPNLERAIDEQPTAYDVDKVVGQLGKIKTDNSCKDCAYKEKCDELQEYYNPSDEVDLCALVTKELSIEIVKSGGID